MPLYVSRTWMEGPDELLEVLMARYVAGDIQAFDALYARVAPRVFAYLISMCRNQERANDVCQTTFLKLHRARNGWIPGSPLMPWLMAIARNTLLDEVRRRARSRGEMTATGEVPEVADPEDPSSRLSEQEQLSSTAEALTRAIEALVAPQREALLLTKESGLSIREAAQVLGTTETAVKLRVHRAYTALRGALKSEAEEA
ncbi:MAG: sigma-70 family RNA polymerase sigma factor [Polyangiaceae bacterium]